MEEDTNSPLQPDSLHLSGKQGLPSGLLTSASVSRDTEGTKALCPASTLPLPLCLLTRASHFHQFLSPGLCSSTPLWAQSILYWIWQKTGVNKVTNQRGSASFCLVSKLNEIREGSESARAGIAQLVSWEEYLRSAATLGKWAIVQQVGYWQAGGVLGQFAMAHFCSWRQKITVLPLIFPPNCFSHDPKANVG